MSKQYLPTGMLVGVVKGEENQCPVCGKSFNEKKCVDGYLHANGKELKREEYPELYSVIGDAYGKGKNGFMLPNMSGGLDGAIIKSSTHFEEKTQDEPSEDQIEEWQEQKEESKERRWRNEKQSLDLLRKNNIFFEVLSETSAHYRVGDFDFWPTTGKYINRKTKAAGRGVFNLIKAIGNRDTRFCEKHDDYNAFCEVIECNDCNFYLR